MTIPPVGASPGSLSPLDENQNKEQKQERAEANQRPDETARPQGERVEISPEAQRIRERQSEITRLQVAERASQAMENDERDVREMLSEHNESRRSGNQQRSAEFRQRIEDRLNDINNRRDAAKFEGEDLLDGREMKFKFGDRDDVLRTPDSKREIVEFVRDIKEALKKNRGPSRDEFFTETREFRREAGRVRSRLEKDVRDSIAGAVRDSSTTRPKDAAEAERLIRDAREARSRETKQNQRSPGMEQIEGRAVDLLQ